MLKMEFLRHSTDAKQSAAECICYGFVLIMLAWSLAKPSLASEWVHGSRDFNRHAYVSTGLGLSHLEPDTSEVNDDVVDRVNPGGQITIGLDMSDWLSLELHSADLGSAGLTPAARINYHVHGVSSLFYTGKNRDNHVRKGLSAFGRIGVGYLENSAVGVVRFARENAAHVLFGAGVEYASKLGLGVRAEIFSFDNDASYSQLALVYRFGRNSTTQAPVANQLNLPSSVSAPVIVPPVTAMVSVNPDLDGDNVVNEIDQCPTSRRGVVVNTAGCALFNGVVDGLNFFSNSARLTPDAQYKLDEIVSILLQHDNFGVNIGSHTDNVGSAFDNLKLSERRAYEVGIYLSKKGIPNSRLAAKAFGESFPIASNSTALGRKQNRRVEIVVHRVLR